MSLVVAEATANGPRIVSDTRVVFPDGPRSSFKTGTLKAIIVARDTTICFAGDVLVGLEGVREFARELVNGRRVDDLLPRLQELVSDGRITVEFIVASGKCNSQLIRIRDNGIERNLPSAWIGDQNGFERFQAERNRSLDSTQSEREMHLPPAARVMNTLQRAMRAVIDDPSIESVNDFCVAVAYLPNGFEYLGSSFIHVGRDLQVELGEKIIPKLAQSVEEGGYSASVVEPAEPGTPA